METTTHPQLESKPPSPISSPNSNGSNKNSSSNGSAHQIHTPPLTPIPITTRSDTNPYPTTFVQADTFTFKQVVQMLTGSSETAKQASSPRPISSNQQDPSSTNNHNNNKSFVIPPIKTTTPKKQSSSSSFKLYERRHNNFKNSLMINTLIPNSSSTVVGNNIIPHHHHHHHAAGFSQRNQEILSPSLLDFPKLVLSPVTPLNHEGPFNKKSSSSPSIGNYASSSSAAAEEERAIAEKGFYLHPSPMSTPRDSEPQLLPLFPVTSPRV